MEQGHSWEADSHSAGQEIPHILRNPKVYYRVDKSPLLVLILSQINPVHSFPKRWKKQTRIKSALRMSELSKVFSCELSGVYPAAVRIKITRKAQSSRVKWP